MRPFLAYPIGILVLYSGLVKARGKNKIYGKHDIFIMDRCFLDELARVEWKLNIRMPFKKVWFRLAPSPDVTFYFDIPGDESWKRMDPQDTGKVAMLKKEKTYKRLLPLYEPFTNMNIINISGYNIKDVEDLVSEKLSNVLSQEI